MWVRRHGKSEWYNKCKCKRNYIIFLWTNKLNNKIIETIMVFLSVLKCYYIFNNDMHESNVYNLNKPPHLSIVGSLSGHPSTSDSLYQTEFL